MAVDEPDFDAAIPGMSLTAEVGSRPWQSPPKYATIEQALEHYIPRMTTPLMRDQLLDIMELGVPLTSLSDTLQTGGVMEGLHSIDVGVLITPVLIEMLAYMAEEADIKFDLGMEGPIDEDKIPDSKIALAIKSVREKMPEALDKEEDVNVEEPVKETVEPTGLMARRM